jgi:hypothetical protein
MPFVFTNRNGGMRWGGQLIVDKNDGILTPTYTFTDFTGYDLLATIGNYTIFGYLNPTTINNAVTLSKNQQIFILAVGGGGGGAGYLGGGGGAGGFLQNTITVTTKDTISITVGSGGLPNGGSGTKSQNGGNTIATFTTNTIYNINALGGGGGGSNPATTGAIGGSGGGGSSNNGSDGALGGEGTSGQGNAGGKGASSNLAGGGGGAATAGNSTTGGNGSLCNLIGITSLYPSIYWAAGGGGVSNLGSATTGTLGGTGSGGSGGSSDKTLKVNSDLNGINYAENVGGGNASSSANNTGSGGGGGGSTGGGGVGGSGIILIATLTSNLLSIPNKYYYYYTAADQIVPIPAGFTKAKIECWGAGGATQGRGRFTTAYNSGAGGGGGYTSAIFTITGYSTMKVIVGQGGISKQNGLSAPATYGGGGGQTLNDGNWGSASGGGRSSVQLNVSGSYTEIITAGGGGGGGCSYPKNLTNIGTGGAGGGLIGGNAYNNSAEGGSGGTQSQGGAPGPIVVSGTVSLAGSQFTGGTGGKYAAGGGGGYYGGGGGGISGSYNFGGGGGGSSYINTTYQTPNTPQTITQGTPPTVANNNGLPTYFQNKIGNGGPVTSSTVVGSHGQHGFVIITYQ